MESGIYNEIICNTREKIYIYDEEFIDTNVKTSEDGIKTVIMLGEQLVEQKLKDGWDVRDKQIKSNKRNSSFQYNELIGKINKVKGENNNKKELLEAYSIFNCNKGIEEVTRNKNILEKIKNEDIKQYFENFMYRQMLNKESHTFDETSF